MPSTALIPLTFAGRQLNIALKSTVVNDEFILCLHGLGCTKEAFDDLWQQSNFTKQSILIPDLVGFGESDKPADFSYTMEDQAQVLLVLLRTFNATRVHIVGHSMGGAIGLLLADLIPDSIASFTNVEGNLVPADCSIASRKVVSYFPDEFQREGLRELQASFLKSEEKGCQLWVKWSAQATLQALYQSSLSLVQWSDNGQLLTKFLNLSARKIYLYGEQNAGMSILQQLPGIPKQMIAHCGHFLMNDNPTDFYRSLASFLH